MRSPAPPRPAATTPRTLSEVAARVGVPVQGPTGPGGPGVAAVTGVTHDSRAVRPGDLYAALPGARTHGSAFVAAAARAGAVAVLTDPAGAGPAADAGLPALVVPDPRARLGGLAAWLYGDPGEALTLLAVTGTNGKTTTAHLIEAVLRHAGRLAGLIGTVETRIGEESVPSVRTTPEATDLQALLAVMRERGAVAAVMEVSSHALVLGRADGTVFDVAVFTNLSQDHLDFHRDLEDYYAAKASLFTPARARLGVVNTDDAHGARLAVEAPIPVVTVSAAGQGDADWRVGGVETAVTAPTAATGFTLAHRDGRRLELVSPLPGAFNVANAALAAVALLAVGLAPDEVAGGLPHARVPGRMERVTPPRGDGPLALVDYAHSPEAVDVVLAALRERTTGRLVAVLGAGGDRDRSKRPAMGAAAARHADRVVVTDDNPRSEEPAAVRAAVLEGARPEARRSGAEVVEVPDRGAAIHAAVRGAGRGDTVVVLGKGHEQGQEVAGTVHPFDDRVVLAEALRGVG